MPPRNPCCPLLGRLYQSLIPHKYKHGPAKPKSPNSPNSSPNSRSSSRKPQPPPEATTTGAPHAAMPAAAQLSLLARARRRRKIRTKLEEVAKVVSSPHFEHEDALALFSESETDCAVLTADGEIIVAKTASTRPFESLAPKIRTIRASSMAMGEYLRQPPLDVVHIRGRYRMVHAYALGPHMLVAVTEVSPGARNLDAVVDRIDRCLGIGAQGSTPIEQLAQMLSEF